MKKILIFIFLLIGTICFGQLSLVNVGTGPNTGNGDPLRTAFQKVNLAITQVNTNTGNILLKSFIDNPVFTTRITTPAIKVGGSLKVQIDSITSDGANIRFYNGATQLTAIPGIGGAIWGTISGSLANQIDLTNALNLKAPLLNANFTGTTTGITAAMVSAMSTSHAANVITGTNISNWNTAYGWGDHAGIGYALSVNVVPITRTVNGHALSGNISVTSTDVNAVNLADSVGSGTGTYLSGKDAVTALALKVNIADTVTMLTPYIARGDTTSMLTPYIARGDTAAMLTPYLARGDSATMLSKYARKNGATFTGTITLPATTSIGTVDATEISYLNNAASNIQQQLYDTIVLSTVAQMQLDTMLYFAPVIGLGNAGDTIAFSHNDVIWGCKWDGTYNLTLTKVNAVVNSGADIDLNLYHDVNFKDATPTKILTSDLTVTSSTAGNDATAFDSATIPHGEFIWLRVEEQTTQPTQCIVSIYGFLVK